MIPFNDLKPLHTLLASEIDEAMQRVFKRGWFILGPEVEAFEAEFAAYHGVPHAIGVGNGTDAIELALRAAGVGKGDEVVTVPHTAVATVNAVERAGATPVLVDIDPQTYTMDINAARAAITPRTKVLLPVHLYGQPADLTALKALAEQHHLLLIEDCAQAHGARWNGQLVGTFGDLATFSFYPTKNLGAYGDGGAVITRDAAYADKLKRLRNYGQTTRYTHVEWGTNSRLDDVQAGILRVKLTHLDQHNAERNTLAQAYNTALVNTPAVTLPYVQPSAYHVFHLYVIRHPMRDALMDALKAQGVGTLIHYPIPIHLQESYRHLGMSAGSLPHTEQAAREILSLPMYIGLNKNHTQVIASAVAACVEQINA
jgi:dTDP-3-amino-3,4,6-trideoxy-alpha-D-glucose transaminase